MIVASVLKYFQSNRIPSFPIAPEEVQCIQCYFVGNHTGMQWNSRGGCFHLRNCMMRTELKLATIMYLITLKGQGIFCFCWHFTSASVLYPQASECMTWEVLKWKGVHPATIQYPGERDNPAQTQQYIHGSHLTLSGHN
jgi:hypothetical protein